MVILKTCINSIPGKYLVKLILNYTACLAYVCINKQGNILKKKKKNSKGFQKFPSEL